MKFKAHVTLHEDKTKEKQISDIKNLLVKAIELLGDDNSESAKVIRDAEKYLSKAGA